MAVFHRWLLVAVAFVSMSLSCAAQETAARFTILISTAQGTAQAGSEIRVNVLLTNTSDHPIWVYVEKGAAAELEGYSIEVRDSQGRLQRTSRYYWSIGRRGGSTMRVPAGSEQDYSDNHYAASGEGSGGYVNPHPGETKQAWFDVNKLYAPLAPGKYTVQVQRTDEERKAVVKSNVITLTVTK
jgi:hypothetical protein